MEQGIIVLSIGIIFLCGIIIGYKTGKQPSENDKKIWLIKNSEGKEIHISPNLSFFSFYVITTLILFELLKRFLISFWNKKIKPLLAKKNK